MSERKANNLHVFLWIIIACLFVTFLASVGIFFLLNDKIPARKTRVVIHPQSNSPRAVVSSHAPTFFAEINEADMPGHYKIDDDGAVMHIFLNEDHTFINKDGTTYQQYNWEVSPDRIVITWQRGSSTFTQFEAPGIYVGKKSNGGTQRMIKLPDLPPADTIAINDKDVVASILFTATIQTNGLALANTEADGAVVPGEAGGEECIHMIRNRSKMSAFLYARIAAELKTVPFTNALVAVEYFDSPARDPRNGWISLQFDSRDAPYTSTAQRVKLSGTMQWKQVTFVLDAPLFTERETDGADFRLCVANPDLSVRSIKLVKNKPF